MNDKTGMRFGMLTVVGLSDKKPMVGSAKYFECKCDCGRTSVVSSSNLKPGGTESCGCERTRRIKLSRITHGKSKHPLYRVWRGMKTRCYNEGSKHYEGYGSCGIKLSDEWRDNFEEFYKWATSNGWAKGLEIDRRDGRKDYSPDNCRFCTKSNNSRNTKPRRGSTSKYKGVYFDSQSGKIIAKIKHDRKKYHLGRFTNEAEAARAYDAKAKELQGEFAWLNADHFDIDI